MVLVSLVLSINQFEVMQARNRWDDASVGVVVAGAMDSFSPSGGGRIAGRSSVNGTFLPASQPTSPAKKK